MVILNIISFYFAVCMISFFIMVEYDLFGMTYRDLLPGLCIIIIGPILLLSIPFIKLYKFLKSIILNLE